MYTVSSISNELSDETQRRCYDCYHLRGAVTWWCKNNEAVEWRGTAIPGVHNCPFWAPRVTEQTIEKRLHHEECKKNKRKLYYTYTITIIVIGIIGFAVSLIYG